MESALRQGLAASETDESKLKNQADQFARLLVARGVVSDGVIDFDAFNDLMSSNKYGDLTSVFQSIDGLATIVDSVIARDLPSNAYLKTEDGKYVVSDNAALKATRGKEAWDAILAATGSYSTIASASRLSQYAYIQQLNAMYDNGIQLSEDEWNTLSSAYGESLIGKKRRASAEWWDTTRDNELINDDGTFKKDESGGYTNQSAFVQQWIQETSARNAFIEETGGTLDQSNELTWSNYLAEAQRQNKRLRNDETIYTSQEQTYYDTLDQNMLYGISGLTQQQSLAGAQDILSAITAGNLSGYLAQDAEMLNAYLSGFSNLSAYVAMAQGLEAEGISNGAGSVYTMNDILGLQESDEGYSAVAAVIDKLGYTMEEARDIAETLNEEMAAVQKPYGELTDEVLANSKAWKGNKREIANAQKTLNET